MSEPRRSRAPSRGRLYTTGLIVILAAVVTTAASALYVGAGGRVLGVGAGTFGIEGTPGPTPAPVSEPVAAPAGDALQRAREFAWAGRHKDAVPAYDTAVVQRPKDRDIALERATTLALAEEYGRAADALAELPGDPYTAEADTETAVLRARYLWWAGRSLEADSLLSAVLEERPGHREAVELQAMVRPTVEPTPLGDRLLEAAGVALGADSLAVAARALDRYLHEVDPSDWRTRLRLARAYAWDGRYTAADEEYRRVLADRPDAWDVRFERARHLWAAGEPARAYHELTRVLDADPDHADALALRAEVRPSLEPSVALAEEWLAEEESVENRLRLARLLVADERYEAALDHYQVALGDATDRDLVMEAADAAHAADAADRVIQLLERHLAASEPADPDLLLRLARTYSWEDRTPEAIRTYARYLDLRPGDADARFERARQLAWSDSTHFAEARTELERVLADDPSRIEALELISSLDRWTAVEVAEEPAAPRPDATAVAWAVELDAFTDTEGFDWLATSVRGDWLTRRGTLSLRLGHGYSAGNPAVGGRLGSTGLGAGIGGRLILAPGLAALGELGAMEYRDIDPFLTWGAGLEYDVDGSMARLRYGRVPAVRDASTMAALQAGATMDRLHLEGTHERGPWLAATDLQLQRFRAGLGDADRYAGMARLDRALGGSGVAVGGMVRGITADGQAPILPDWGALYWTPDHYIAPALSVRYGATIADGLWVGLRAAPGVAFIAEDGAGNRYDSGRTAILEAGGTIGWRTGPWQLEVSGDWGGALPDGYNASSLRIQLSRPGGTR